MLKELIFNKDVKTLSKTLFNVILTPKQRELVRTIAYKEHKRIITNAMTRYGKSMSISVAVLLYILFNENKKIKIIAPTYPQARIIMNYMADYLSKTDILVNLIEYEATGADRLKKEVTKSRITFKNGCELMILSAEGKASRIMGFGGDLIICVPYDTIISTDKGNLKIGDIVTKKIKCNVVSYNVKKDILELKEIDEYFSNGKKENIEIKTDSGSLTCTNNHPVFVVGKGFVNAEDVKINDKLMCLSKDLNILNGVNIVNDCKMRSLWNYILQKTKPRKKSQSKHLQFEMSRNNVFKGSKQESNYTLQEMRKTNKNKAKSIKKVSKQFLFNKLQSRILFWKKKCCIQRKNNKELCNVQQGNEINSSKRKYNVLQHGLQKQSTFIKYDGRKKPSLEKWNWKRTISLFVYKKIKIINKTKIQKYMSYLWKTIFSRISCYTPHKLQQKRHQTREFNPFMFKLPRKNKLQQGLLETKTVKEIKKNDVKDVFNISVKDNNNYFADSFLVHNCDESCLIPLEVYQERISRMLGDDSESMLVEIGNPFDKNNQFYQHWTDPNFFKIHVDWKMALAEGRVTQEFIDEQKLNLTALQFRILYEADFPDEATDQLFPEKALKKMIYLPERDEPHFLKHPCTKRKLGVDIARFGLDLTVLITIEHRGGIDYITDIIYYEKQDTMVTVGKIKNLHEKMFFDAINIDEPGIGEGPFDRLKEVITNSSVIPFVGGSETPQEKEKYLNCKAFWYLQLVKSASDGTVKILNHVDRSRLLMELRELRYDFDSRGRVRIIKDKNKKSPDFADALNIGMFEGNDFFIEFV